jgi:hypothetical protein
VACPFFMPQDRLDDSAWKHAPRLPLGDAYRGVCHSDPSHPFDPRDTARRDLCNYGYARGRCDRFPPDSSADAIRFSVAGDENGRIRLVYIAEKDHAPAQHGSVESSVEEIQSIRVSENELISKQARVFLESYLRRKRTNAIQAGERG